MDNNATSTIWRRLKFSLSPQLSIYKHIAQRVVGKRVWEVGFGTGFGTVQLARYANKVYATDIDPNAVEFAREVFPLENVVWMVGDVTISNPTNKHDVVVCLEVLEHVSKWQSALKNIKERLTREGVLIISGPNANADLRKNDLHEREWTAQEFHEALSKYFTSVELYDYSLKKKQSIDTHATPILAVCKNE